MILKKGLLLREDKMVNQRKIVIIRGKVTAGKTTISHELTKVLPGWIFIDPWKIKEMFEPLGLKDRTPLKEVSKKAMVLIIKEVIRRLKINIIVQETSHKYLMRYLRKDLKKYNYKIYSIFLDVDFEDAMKRDIQREKPTMNLGKGVKNNKDWKKIKAQPDKGDIIINTSHKSIKEVISYILKIINEKKGVHPKADWIRKSW